MNCQREPPIASSFRHRQLCPCPNTPYVSLSPAVAVPVPDVSASEEGRISFSRLKHICNAQVLFYSRKAADCQRALATTTMCEVMNSLLDCQACQALNSQRLRDIAVSHESLAPWRKSLLCQTAKPVVRGGAFGGPPKWHQSRDQLESLEVSSFAIQSGADGGHGSGTWQTLFWGFRDMAAVPFCPLIIGMIQL